MIGLNSINSQNVAILWNPQDVCKICWACSNIHDKEHVFTTPAKLWMEMANWIHHSLNRNKLHHMFTNSVFVMTLIEGVQCCNWPNSDSVLSKILHSCKSWKRNSSKLHISVAQRIYIFSLFVLKCHNSTHLLTVQLQDTVAGLQISCPVIPPLHEIEEIEGVEREEKGRGSSSAFQRPVPRKRNMLAQASLQRKFLVNKKFSY